MITNKKCKIWSKGVAWGHMGSRDTLVEFQDPPNISGTNVARNFKFGRDMDSSDY